MVERYDIARLRKEHGMSQSELAQRIQVKQSFLSAIENGRSPLPADKEQRILELFGLTSLQAYVKPDAPAPEPAEGSQFVQLLNEFHTQAHRSSDDTPADRLTLLEERNYRLTTRNDALNDKIDELRDENERLRHENARLKDLLLRHSIPLDEC